MFLFPFLRNLKIAALLTVITLRFIPAFVLRFEYKPVFSCLQGDFFAI
jgi:hypothetical protein